MQRSIRSIVILSSTCDFMVGAHVLDHRDGLELTIFRCAKTLIDSRLGRNRGIVMQAAILLSCHSDSPKNVATSALH